MPADLSVPEVAWRDDGPRPGVWADLTAARHPSLRDRNPAAVAWRDLLVDPALGGLVPGRSGPRCVEVAGWRLPLTGILATPLAWHPRLPLVAGLLVRGRHAHPWVADLHARTAASLTHVRAATSLTDRGGAPLAWCAGRRLALLTPAGGDTPSAGSAKTGPAPADFAPVVLEATGPGRLEFEPDAAALRRHAAARVSTVDLLAGAPVPHTDPLLVHDLRACDGGLLVEHAAPQRGPEDRTETRLPIAAEPVTRRLASRPSGPDRLPAPDDGVPAVLWLHAEPPVSLTAAGVPVHTLDLDPPWPGDAGAALLHDRIVTPVEAALRRLPPGTLIGGHSFGATLALYALAHLAQPAAAIVHSGCYNRTLTPSGFQREKRRYWDAPDVYQALSAFHFADRLDRPVLLAHGTDDLNPATTPEQAVAFYRALVAAGGHARLVLLPGEGHTFHHRESLACLAAEHRAWAIRWGSR